MSSRREVQLSRDEGRLLPELLPICADHSRLAIPMNRKVTRSESSPLQEDNWP